MDKLEVLSSSPLFEMLSNQELEYIADLTRPKRFSAGQTIFEEGELGDSLYLIAQGEVEVIRRDAAGQPKTIAVLGANQFFGEMSLIDKEYRSATVKAKADAELMHLTAENLTAFRKQHRDGFTFVVINIARVISSRLREANTRLTARL
jgi:CRP-like cAMP-binding protein